MMEISRLYKSELKDIFSEKNEPSFRAKQLFEWLHGKRVTDFSQMTNLPAVTRGWLASEYTITRAECVRRQRSSDGTEKYLLSFADGNCVETVAMLYEHGLSVCVSTQVGCRMGCRFCASTQNGLVRSLTAGEMLAEVYAASELYGMPVDSVVLMGIGEPLDNFDEVVRFYDILTDADGYGMKNRAVTLSTCGIIPQILRLAELKKQLTLSISLHAAFSDKRSSIMPVNLRYPLEELMPACRRYVEITGRRISFEYTVIHGFNDGDDDADKLSELVRGFQSHVNVIPVNEAGRGDFRATRKQAENFAEKLTSRGVNATVRRTLGNDISAACGQLRRDTINEDHRSENSNS